MKMYNSPIENIYTRFFGFFILFNGLFLSPILSQTITDNNFAAAIRTACPTCIDNANNLLPDAASLTSLDVNNKGISSLAGLAGFMQLEILYCYNNPLSSLPTLPSTLQVLNCGITNLTALPTLPSTLLSLSCYNSKLTSLPTLPSNLAYLNADNNKITSLPTLPSSLRILYIGNNLLTVLPTLPLDLVRFSVWSNPITALPNTLPSNLIELGVHNTPLSILPTLPNTLQHLSCYGTTINCLPTLPTGLTTLLLDPSRILCLPNTPTNCTINNGVNTTDIRGSFSVCGPQIPDVNFANAIRGVCPTCINGCNYLAPAAASLTSLNVPTGGIADLTGLAYFSNLETFNCYNNPISSLPTLPSTLKVLNCGISNLTSLPSLPTTLTNLSCYNSKLTSLPTLPSSLVYLHVDNNQLTSLPTLPSSLRILYMGGNQLTTLPILPDGLARLSCWSNPITALPNTLPSGLLELGVHNTPLSILPTLPNTLQHLSCYGTTINCLPTLPTGLTTLLLDPSRILCLPNMPTNCTINNGANTTDIRSSFVVCGIKISDANFANAIRNQCPNCINYCDNLTSNAANLTTLNISNALITDLTGIEGFTNLQSLYCNYNGLTSLPSNLPSGLTTLSCANTLINALPTLPSGLTTLYCGNTFLSSLPTNLPSGLRTLDCANAYLTALPANLPSNLLTLNCKNNQLTALPTDMPPTLTEVNCDNNALTSLPVFSSALRFLYCRNNQITNLLSVPFSSLSSDLRYLYCSNNRLTQLPENLPGNLLEIECFDNAIYCLPTLPNSLTVLKLDKLKITCLPNIVVGLMIQNQNTMGDISGDYGLCDAPSIVTHPSVSGMPQGGQTVIFTAKCTNNSVTTVKWQRKGATDMNFTDIVGSESAYTSNTDATYQTPNLTNADIGASYRAVFTSQCSGGATTNAVTLNFTVIPVELTHFSGKSLEKHNILTWSVASQRNFSHYTIERTESDATHWTAIGQVAAHVYSDYQFDDKQPLSLAYYRLAMVDLDGSMRYSKTISIDRQQLKTVHIKVYPNPATTDVTVEIPQNTEGVHIINSIGQVVFQEKTMGKNTVQIDVNTWQSGIYFVRIMGAEGLVRFIKN